MKFSTSLQYASICIIFGFIWTQTNGQYETPNNVCGGFFRYIRGSINFTFHASTTNRSDTEKMCMWTVAPTRQYNQFYITAMNFPNFACDDYSVTINALKDRSKGVASSVRYCKGSEPSPLPFILEGSVMVIILKVKSVGQIIDGPQGTGFYMSYKEFSESDWNNSTQLINTYYSFGRPSVEPIPYYAASFISNGMSTFGFIKANQSNGLNYEFQLSYDTIKFGYLNNCGLINDFLMMCPISPTGALINPIIYEKRNYTSTETYKSGYGFFIIYWGGRNCSIGGGGSMQLYYDSVRIS